MTGRAAVLGCTVADYLMANGTQHYVAVIQDMDGGMWLFEEPITRGKLCRELMWDGNGDWDMPAEELDTLCPDWQKYSTKSGNVQDPKWITEITGMQFFSDQLF